MDDNRYHVHTFPLTNFISTASWSPTPINAASKVQGNTSYPPRSRRTGIQAMHQCQDHDSTSEKKSAFNLIWNFRGVFVWFFLWRSEDFPATLAIVTVYWECPVQNVAMWIHHLLTKMQQMQLMRSSLRCCAWLEKEVGVTETSMQASRKDRRAACEWKADAGWKLGRARDCRKICNAVLTYIPTNVYTAWRYVCGLPNCEKEFALEGVTHLEGATHGNYLQHLPRSIEHITFGDDFDQRLERVTLPSDLRTLSLGHCFDQSLERVTLPSSLQSLSFGDDFNQSLERVTLPSSLQSLSFGRDFNQSLERVTLPSSLQSFSQFANIGHGLLLQKELRTIQSGCS